MIVIVFFAGVIAGGAVTAWVLLIVALAQLPKRPASPVPARPERIEG